jgi:hypothetical protein
MMDLIKKYKVVIVIVIIILILVCMRLLDVNHFKNDAKKWAEPSVTRLNTINIEKSGSLSGKKLFINLDKDVSGIKEITNDAQTIPPDSVLSKKYLKIIRKHDGPVLLFSSETAVSARIWMVLSQMGCMNIYILTNNEDNEVFKYKFRPDTLPGPEF